MLPNQTKTTWKDYIFSWPTYLVMGIALAYTVDKTQVLNPLLAKFWKEKEEESDQENNL